MLTVVIPTLNEAHRLAPTLAALVPAVVEGLVRQVVISDGGSTDETLKIADVFGCDIAAAAPGRGRQLAAGAEVARQGWLLFLHADTVLEPGWHVEVARFIEQGGADRAGRRKAAVFRFALDDTQSAARRLEWLVGLRWAVLALPYGDQGLLIERSHYEDMGGFHDLPLMEDVDLVRRIGRRGLTRLGARAVTSADRYRRKGYLRRSARNLACLALYVLHVPPRLILRLYG